MSVVTSLSDLLRWPPCPLVTLMTCSRSGQGHRPFPWQHAAVLALVVMTTCLSGVQAADLCPSPSARSLSDAIYQHATPRGRLEAGKYAKVSTAQDLVSCVETCCQTLSCEVVFFHKDNCYLITCNKTKPENCDPVDMTGNSKYEETSMVLVRNYRNSEGLLPLVGHRVPTQLRSGSNTTGVIPGAPANETVLGHEGPSPTGSPNGAGARVDGADRGRASEASRGSSVPSLEIGAFGDAKTSAAVDVNVTATTATSSPSVGASAATSSLATSDSLPGRVDSSNLSKAPAPSPVQTPAPGANHQNISKPKQTNAPGATSVEPMKTPVTAAPNVSSNAIGQSTLNQSHISEDLSNMLDQLGPSLSSIGRHGDLADDQLSRNNPGGGDYGGDGTFYSDDALFGTDRHGDDVSGGGGGGDVSRHGNGQKRAQDISCTYGLGECVRHEECQLRNSRSKVGLCRCVEGYRRDSTTNFCVVDLGQAVTTVTSDNADSVVTTALPPISDTVLIPDKKSHNETSDILPPEASMAPPILQLTVSAGESRTLILPENKVVLSAFVIPQAKNEETYNYEWSTVSHPVGAEGAVMADKNTASLKLSKLDVVGLYLFKVVVTASGKYGSATVNVTVKPELRINKIPVAVIKPPVQEVQLPNSVVLDGSVSTDDDKIVKYQWEEVTGPLQNIENSNSDVLMLKGLVAGEYRFKLTVTDSDGASNSTFANVTVIKEPDYKPQANAGSNVVINLPQNSVTLSGNLSTDDHGIVGYEWTKKSDDSLTADMKGVRSSVLQLNNLQQGDYIFTLKVTDTSGQTSTADVHVFVKQENNQPPVARTGTNQVVTLPVSSASLDGTKSSDDQKIVKYSWEQISGPDSAIILDKDKALGKVSNLKLGEYQFKLTVFDEKDLQSEDTMTVTVTENENFPPQAHAGGDQIIYQPAWLVTLNGSKSVDDKKIVTYLWTREEQSLAAGEVVNDTDRKPILLLVNLVPGRYVFTLTVRDEDGEMGRDTASVIVKKDPRMNNLVELHIGASITTFTEAQKADWKEQLALLLRRQSERGDASIEIVQIEPIDARKELSIKFYVYTVSKSSSRMWNGTEVREVLKEKMQTEAAIMDYPLLYLDTVVCQNNCSGHGRCEQATKQCLCDPYWMENFLKANLMNKERNCDWSILYVVIVMFLLSIGLGAAVWIIVYCRRRCRRRHPSVKRQRYQLLEDLEDDNKIDLEMSGRGKSQRSVIMLSDSDDGSSDEETLFINQKSSNGHLRKTANGHLKQKNKLKA